jgi:hypothetical protein
VANYLAAILIVAAVALFVAAPLSGGFPRRRRSTILELELERLEHDRGLAVQGLRELEFDREMGKLDDADYRDLKRSLEDRALSAMTAIERAHAARRAAATASPMRRAARLARPASAVESPVTPVTPLRASSSRRMSSAAGAGHPVVNFCPQCGVRVGAGHNFCAACGANLNAITTRSAARAD